MHRRLILQSAAALTLGAGHVQLMAAAAGTPRLLIVFLRGAYDATSLLVPVSSSFYYEQRPNIAIARPDSGPDAALRLDPQWGLHPAVADTMLPRFERGQLAFVPFTGTDDTSRSHFETQDSIELGQSLNGPRNFQSGFMNRLAQVLGASDAIAFTAQLPLALRGAVPVPNLALNSLARPSLDVMQAQRIVGMYDGTRLAGSVQEGFAVRDDAVRAMQGTASAAMPGGVAGEMLAASRDAITARGFEGEARRVARLMRERYRLGFIDVGGWDTHVGQGGASGYLANRLNELGKGLNAYAVEMGPAWRDSIVIVMSEFGRTFRENGNRGTDHGHGSVYWALGGAVRGGRILGEQQVPGPANLFQNRDDPVLNEYRSVLGGLFQRLYGLSGAQVQQVFLGVVPRDIGLV